MSTQTSELLYVEDLLAGDGFDCREINVDRDEMLEFANRYDPQTVHTNAANAED